LPGWACGFESWKHHTRQLDPPQVGTPTIPALLEPPKWHRQFFFGNGAKPKSEIEAFTSWWNERIRYYEGVEGVFLQDFALDPLVVEHHAAKWLWTHWPRAMGSSA
jgi:hypothetical protein